MKFALMMDLARLSPEETIEENLQHLVHLTQLAEGYGFETVYVGEHHGHEYTIGPAPFTLLTYLAGQTSTIHLGPAVIAAPYWHPIRLAGEAALFDIISGGRLELAIGRGAFPYEFARMADGMSPEASRASLGEMIPAVRGLWRGNYAHIGTTWNFPSTTSTPRPRTADGPPLWVAARHPDSFAIAIENNANLMVNPLGLGIEEVRSLNERRVQAVQEADTGFSPQMAVLRNTHVAADEQGIEDAVDAYIHYTGYFDNLFRTDGDVHDGWVAFQDPYTQGDPAKTDRGLIRRNQMYDTADRVIDRLAEYEAAGTDTYLYLVADRLPQEEQIASVRRFGEQVIPAFAKEPHE